MLQISVDTFFLFQDKIIRVNIATDVSYYLYKYLHIIKSHSTRKIKIITFPSSGKSKTRTFNIIGDAVEHDPSKISFDEETNTYHIHTHKSTDSPVHKIKRINTPTKPQGLVRTSPFLVHVVKQYNIIHSKGK